MVLGHTGPAPPDLLQAVVPNSPTAGVGAYGSHHSRGSNFALCDGSVKFVKDTVPKYIFSALATRSRGEVISLESF
jgi:prepilin-type processing-associated H-X9-DG protein